MQYKAPVKIHGDTTTDVIVTATLVDGGVRCTLAVAARDTDWPDHRDGALLRNDLLVDGRADPLPPMGLADHPISKTRSTSASSTARRSRCSMRLRGHGRGTAL